MLGGLRAVAQRILDAFRGLIAQGFAPQLNPLNHLGALTIYFCWIVLVSGIWLLVFFRTSVEGAYESVEYLTREQWYLGGVMRSLHRYASDAAIVTLVLHIISEFVYDRYRGSRWFSWITGVPLLWLLIPLGITGYWLVWDQLAWYVALTSAELLDWLPIFNVPMAGNFLSDSSLSDRFFTLMAFLHLIGLPLFLVFGIWLHVLRIDSPRINPPRALMAGSLLALIVLSLVYPAVSQGPVDLTRFPSSLGLDWFYLPVYPLAVLWSTGDVWALLVGFSVVVCALPWLPSRRPRQAAHVDLDNCNGCARCADDCPFSAITMEPRSDGKSYVTEAVVDPALCVSCGLCTGSCPTSTPFRKQTALVPGIDMPDLPAVELRERIIQAAQALTGSSRILVFGCQEDPGWKRQKKSLCGEETGTVDVLCAGHLPPSFVDFVLSRDFADGIVIAGCQGGNCRYRLGAKWTSARMARRRDPRLRARIDTARLSLGWEEGWHSRKGLARLVQGLRDSLSTPENGAKAAEHGRPAGRVRWLGAALAYAIFLAPVGLLSAWPPYGLIGGDQAVISVSFSMAGDRIEECRRFTQEELEQLPPNMRRPSDCPRERFPVRVLIRANGSTLYDDSVPPAGLWSDGAAHVYHRVTVPAGQQVLFVGANTRGEDGEFDHALSQTVDLTPGQHVVVEFDGTNEMFFLRLE